MVGASGPDGGAAVVDDYVAVVLNEEARTGVVVGLGGPDRVACTGVHDEVSILPEKGSSALVNGIRRPASHAELVVDDEVAVVLHEEFGRIRADRLVTFERERSVDDLIYCDLLDSGISPLVSGVAYSFWCAGSSVALVAVGGRRIRVRRFWTLCRMFGAGNWSGTGGRRGGLILSSVVLMISLCLGRRRLWSCLSGFRGGMR